MKKTSLRLSLACVGFFSLAILLSNCKGEKGDPGPAVNGTNGTNGTNGANGAGFDEAVKDGNIIVYLEGKRPDGIAFKDTLNFKFAPSSLEYSRAYSDGTDADYYVEFHTGRFLTFDNQNNESGGDAFAGIYFDSYLDDETADTIRNFNFYLNADVITSDYKYFRLNDSYYSDENTENEIVTNYKYDPSKGTLRYKLKFMVPADDNATGFDLNVSATVNTIVYESIGGDEGCGDCRKNAKNTNARKSVTKAEMKSLK